MENDTTGYSHHLSPLYVLVKGFGCKCRFSQSPLSSHPKKKLYQHFQYTYAIQHPNLRWHMPAHYVHVLQPKKTILRINGKSDILGRHIDCNLRSLSYSIATERDFFTCFPQQCPRHRNPTRTLTTCCRGQHGRSDLFFSSAVLRGTWFIP